VRPVNGGNDAVYALANRRQKKPDRYIPAIGVRPLTGVGSGAPLKQLVGDGQETVPQHLRNPRAEAGIAGSCPPANPRAFSEAALASIHGGCLLKREQALITCYQRNLLLARLLLI